MVKKWNGKYCKITGLVQSQKALKMVGGFNNLDLIKYFIIMIYIMVLVFFQGLIGLFLFEVSKTASGIT